MSTHGRLLSQWWWDRAIHIEIIKANLNSILPLSISLEARLPAEASYGSSTYPANSIVLRTRNFKLTPEGNVGCLEPIGARLVRPPHITLLN